jgi:hypothetical protein
MGSPHDRKGERFDTLPSMPSKSQATRPIRQTFRQELLDIPAQFDALDIKPRYSPVRSTDPCFSNYNGSLFIKENESTR